MSLVDDDDEEQKSFKNICDNKPLKTKYSSDESVCDIGFSLKNLKSKLTFERKKLNSYRMPLLRNNPKIFSY